MIERGIKVLLIEDNPDDHLLVKESLRVAGVRHDLVWVDRMSAALEHLASNDTDVILLDLSLPDSSGLESVTSVCSHSPNIPVIVLTGLNDETLASQAVRSGAQDYIGKGHLNPEALARTIRHSMERIQILSKLESYSLELEAAEIRLRTIIECAADGLIVVDHEGIARFVNPAAEIILGRSGTDVLGKPFGFPILLGETTELDIVLPSGETKTAEMRVVEVDWQGAPAHLASLIDITQRVAMEHDLREKSRLASIGEMAAGVAHEINNPLNSAMGFVQLLLDEDLPQCAHDDLQKIYSEAQRAARVVANLLSFARKRDTHKQFVDVHNIVERALQLKSFELNASNVEVKLEMAPGLTQTMADEDQLVEVVLNLITNAEQAMASESGKGQLTIRSDRKNGGIRLSIKDDGPGIATENLDKIFDPFYTTKEVGKGTGLGLSICHGIVHQHGGELWVESVEGEGTTFHLDLPILDQEEAQESQTMQPSRPAVPAKTVLVVDDDPGNLDLLETVLTVEGYQVDVARDGQQAWHRIQNKAYDCIFLDLKMPILGGQQLFQQVYDYDEELAKRIIFMTGDSFSSDSHHFLATTGNRIMEKPFDLNALQQHIDPLKEVALGIG